jgi:3-O-methylgallate 3,4-dioxygenase
MAKVVLGFGSSHAPQLRLSHEHWPEMIQKDTHDPRFDYEAVLKRAKPDMESELTPEVMKLRDESNHRALGILRQKLEDAAPDVIVVIGDDQHEQFFENNMPMFSVYHGASLPVRERRRQPDPKLAAAWTNTSWNATAKQAAEADHPTDVSFADHIIHEMVEDGFDIAVSNQLREEIGVGHAFSFLYQFIMPELNIPVVPVTVNAFYPPNQPTPRRAFQMGESVRKAIDSWDPTKKVAVMASGGLSHFIIDEELDRMTLDGLARRDEETLANLPRERLMQLGTTEGLNWIALSGAMTDEKMSLIDYVPCYRTPAGTGCAMAFAYWE